MGGEAPVAVAMSGGVDSTVAAMLLRDQGLAPVGLTLRLQGADDATAHEGCLGAPAAARRAAAALGIPHYTVEAQAIFEARVLRAAWLAYDRGLTPNPCVICNQQLKFGLLLDEARRLGLKTLATGHYARKGDGGAGRSRLLRGLDRGKDQSYFLFALSRGQLEAALFPLGELSKAEVRELARLHGLPNAARPDSQDACLPVGEHGFAETLRLHFGAAARPGPVEASDGRPLGAHTGIHRFTVGQRRGLGVSLPTRSYVVRLDPGRDAVVVGGDEALRSTELVADQVCWLEPPTEEDLEVEVQIRYRHRATRAQLSLDGSPARVRVRFRDPQRAVTPGQAAVFYRGDVLLGGGWISGARRP